MFSFGGQPQQQQPTSNLFGQPASPSPFGVAPLLPGAQPSGGFFGQPAPSTASTSLFGAAPAAQPTGGLFGQPTAAPASAGLFHQQPAATGLTGATPFGQPATAAPSPFGQPAGGGLFGGTTSTAVSPTPTAFGASPFGGAVGGSNGTAIQKYQTTRDQELNMKLVSITAMDCYKSKSVEELRWEDIQSGRGQPGAQATPTPAATSAWGATPQPATTGGLFGATTPAPASGGLFGQAAAAPASGGFFGTSSTTTQPTGGLFGQPSATPPTSGGLLGHQPATAAPASGGLFGQPASTPSTGGLFGATPAAQTSTGGMFGSTIAAAPASGGHFGASSTATSGTGGGLFGSAPLSTGAGLFGAAPAATPATGGGLFGSAPPPAAGTTGSLFGSTAATPAATGGGLFGSATSTTQPAASGGLFGASTTSTQPAATGGLFGSTITQPSSGGGGLFGTSTSTTTLPGTGGLFGSAAPSGGLFGTSTAAAPGATGGLFGTSTTTPSAGGGLFGASTTTTPFTGGGLFGSSTGGLFGTSTSTPALPSSSGGGLFGSLGGASTSTAPVSTGTGLGFAQGGLFGSPVGVATQPGAAATLPPPPVPRPSGLVAPKPVDKDSLSAFLWKDKTGESATPLIKKRSVSGPPSPKTFVPKPTEEDENKRSETPKGYVSTAAALGDNGEAPLRISTGSPKAPVVRPKIIYTTPTKDVVAKGLTSPSVLPVCANHNMWTKPSIEAMSGMTEHELSRIEHFQIGHYGVGSVTWPGLTDVRFLVIDDIIVFKKGSVTLFPDEDLKPPMGTGLNKTAIIELIVKPKNFDLAKKYESRYAAEMQKLTESNGAEFLSYDLETWRFRVEHFSTWGIDESEWLKIDTHADDHRPAPPGGLRNDLSLFSRIEQELGQRHEQSLDQLDEDEEWVPETMEDEHQTDRSEAVSFRKEDFVGALAVPPPTREELKQMGWDLKLLDLFQNQSFRACLGLNGVYYFPEHPVIDDMHKVVRVTGVTESVSCETANEIETLVMTLAQHRDTKNWTDLIDSMESTVGSGKTGSGFKSVFSLIKALFDNTPQTDLDISPSGREPINTAALNEWLSKINAEWIRSNPNLAFSPAAAMCSRHYSPTATELLVNSGHPRLALAAAAGIDHNSRRLMEAQMSQIKDSDKSLQRVADILGGNSHKVNGINWRADLALRYWYTENGDLSGFEPPASSLEWRLIKTVVLSNSSEILQLKEQLKEGTETFLLFVVVYLLKLRKSSLVQDADLQKVVMSCSDFVLNHPGDLNWQLSPIILSFLPASASKSLLINDVVSRNIEKGYGLIEKLGIVDHEQVVSAKAVHALSDGRPDIAKTMLATEGMSKAATGLIDSMVTADSKL